MQIDKNAEKEMLENLQKAEECIRTSIDLAKRKFGYNVIMTNNMYYAINYINSTRKLLEICKITSKYTPEDIGFIIVEFDYCENDEYSVELPDGDAYSDMYGICSETNRDTKKLSWKINVEEGKIDGWPEGMQASTNIKFQDCGVYSLLAKDGTLIRRYRSYVPSIFNILCKDFGDYLCLNIDKHGNIEQWKQDLRYAGNEKISMREALLEMLRTEGHDVE